MIKDMRIKRIFWPGLVVVALSGLLLPLCSSSKHAAPNVVLVVIDALRPDFLGCYGYGRPVSPNIDDLARRGILFENAVSHAPWTKTSFSSILTSLYPFQHGVIDWESVMPDTLVTLPEVLRGQGYSTMAVINMLGITGEFKVTKGIEKLSEADKGERDAFRTTDDAIGLIKNSPKPFFIMIHYFDTHRPYRPPPEYVDRVREQGDPDPFAGSAGLRVREGEKPSQQFLDRERLLYSACIRHVDEAVGRLVKFLDEAGLRRETLLIITADHGEAFWEHGVMAHGGNLYDEVVRVPLIIAYPDEYRRAQRIVAQARHIDLLPTILDLAGISDERRREGVSLRPLIEQGKREAAPARMFPQDVSLCESSLKKAPDTKCMRTNDLKLIVEPATALFELYNLQADPAETVNLWGKDVAGSDSLHRMLDRVPGAKINGWRVALTGDPAGAIALKVTMPKGGRLTRVQRVTAPGELSVEIPPDSTSLNARALPKGLQILVFDVEPKDAQVVFKVSTQGKEAPSLVHVGTSGTRPIGAAFASNPQEALGLPDAFEEFRTSARAGVHIWWLPGGEMREGGQRATLSPEAKKRLKALGYVQ